MVASADASAAAPTWTKGPYLQDLTTSSVYVDAEVDPPGPVQLDVQDETPATTDAGGDAAAANVSAKKTIDVLDSQSHDFHALHVTGLQPAHRYRYTVRSGDAVVTSHFTTPPADDSAAPFSFVVYGDNRTDDAAHAAVVKRIADTPGDFLVNTGDLVEDGSIQDDWKTFFRIEGTILKERCLYACVGNHELIERAGSNYLTYFGPRDLGCTGPNCERPIRLYGTFRWSNARFFLLNGMDDFATGVEKDWLAAELTRADAEPGLTWRIVVLHHGPYSSGPHGDNERLDGAKIPELLRAHRVDLVLSGHDHLYERGLESGLRYVVSGGGGAPLYRQITPRPSTRRVEAVHHVTRFEVSPSEIRMTATRVDGTVLETCGFGAARSDADWDCDAKTSDGAVPSSPNDGGAIPSVNTTPPERTRCTCGIIGAADSSVSWGASAAAFAGAALVLANRRRARHIRHRS